jgi:hypothetical protein
VDYGFEDFLVDGEKGDGGRWKSQEGCTLSQVDGFRSRQSKIFQYLDQSKKPAKLRRFRKWEYEIAISPKEQESWTFVNGNGMNALQLRKIFKFLPKEDKEFQFPEVKVEELK